MESSSTLIYDGSFNGFLTAVYVAFDKKINVAYIQKNNQSQSGLFSESETVFTNVDHAKRVWNGIRTKSHNAITQVYFAFLSETEGIEMMLYTYIEKLICSKPAKAINYMDHTVAYIEQLSRKVRVEKLHMERTLQFQKSQDSVYFAQIEPSFDVLPLISKHFRDCRPDQQWLIFDVKRNYGIFYNSRHMEIVGLTHLGALTTKEIQRTNFNNHIKSKLLAPSGTANYQRKYSEQREAV